jgi:hypothetical protein
MPIKATIQAVKQVGDGVAVSVSFDDGSVQQFDFNPVPSGPDIRASVQAEVRRRNAIDTQVMRLQNLVGVVFD